MTAVPSAPHEKKRCGCVDRLWLTHVAPPGWMEEKRLSTLDAAVSSTHTVPPSSAVSSVLVWWGEYATDVTAFLKRIALACASGCTDARVRQRRRRHARAAALTTHLASGEVVQLNRVTARCCQLLLVKVEGHARYGCRRTVALNGAGAAAFALRSLAQVPYLAVARATSTAAA